MVEKWRGALDKSQKCGVLFTDLSKAFDCLLHDLLIAHSQQRAAQMSSLNNPLLIKPLGFENEINGLTSITEFCESFRQL